MIQLITNQVAAALRGRLARFRNGFTDSPVLSGVHGAMLEIVRAVNVGPERRGATIPPCTRQLGLLGATFPDGTAGGSLVARLAEQMGAYVKVMEERRGQLTADALARTMAAVEVFETLDTIMDLLSQHRLVRSNLALDDQRNR